MILVAPYAQSIGHPVDVVEPGCDKGYLEYGFIIETCGPQSLMVTL